MGEEVRSNILTEDHERNTERREIIDGVYYDLIAMGSPSYIHQRIVAKSLVEIELFIRSTTRG